MPTSTRSCVATAALPDIAYFPLGGGPTYADLKAALLRVGFSNIQTSGSGDYVSALSITISGSVIQISPTSGGVPHPKPQYDTTALISLSLSN